MKLLKVKKNKKGFALLFAIILSTIILSISLGVANIAYHEIKFGTSAKETNEAFFAADAGAECTLFNDKFAGTVFLQSGGSGTVQCLGRNIPVSGASPSWSFIISELGATGQSCAKITIAKDFSVPPLVRTTVVSKGYNIGGSVRDACTPGASAVERELDVTY